MSAWSSEAVVEIEGLSRSFGRKAALRDVSLSVPRGAVFGLVGENAAGKTTLIKHILGLLKAQTGTVRVLGLSPVSEPVQVLSRLGYLSEDRDLPEWMRLHEMFRYLQAFYPTWDAAYAEELRRQFDLDPRRPYQDALARPAHGRACWRRSRSGPSCWCSMSLRPALTRSYAGKSYRQSFARSHRRGGRSSSRRTCSTRSSGFPITLR